MALTVNADDFGISPEVNRAIDECLKKGLINRTTLMVNMPYAEDAILLAREGGYLDKVGIHINLTAGKALCRNMSDSRVFCDDKGEFTADFARDLKTRFFLDRQASKCLEEELRAQLDAYRQLGGILWHIDSHHHVHTDPSIWKVMKKVLKDYPVTSVRLGRNMYRGGNPLMHIYKRLLNASIDDFNREKSGYFGSAADYKEYTGGLEEAERERFSCKKPVEIMVHPMPDEYGNITDSMDEFYKIL